MKKILLVILVLVGIIIPIDVYAVNVRSVEDTGQVVVRINGGEKEYKEIKKIVRDTDNRFVYSLKFDNEYEYSDLKETSNVTEKLNLIAYYGYNFNSTYTEHRDIKWYIVTQYLIWKENDKESEYYFVDNNYNIEEKYVEEIEEMNDIVSKHDLLPSFAKEYFEVDNDNKLVLEDDNSVLERFNLINTSGLSVVSIKNKLYLYSDISVVRSILFSKTGDKYINNPIIYTNDNGVDYILPGKFKGIYFSVYYKPMEKKEEIKDDTLAYVNEDDDKENMDTSVDNVNEVVEEIEVPDTYLKQKDYFIILYSFMVVIGFCILGVESEKNIWN